jgi:hypothetical protein
MRILRPEEVIANGFPPGSWKEELTPEELKEAYALGRAAFTAADLQLFTEVEKGIPAEDVLNEMDAAQREFDQRIP